MQVFYPLRLPDLLQYSNGIRLERHLETIEAQNPENSIPIPGVMVGIRALGGILRRRSLFGAMEVFREQLGDTFRLPLPGQMPVMLVGPEANHYLLVHARDALHWRSETDPITVLLRHGVLVEDGEAHDQIRRAMSPALHRQIVTQHVNSMLACADRVIHQWRDGETLEMFSEMRKISITTMGETLYGTDLGPDLPQLRQQIRRTVRYVAPGLWILWPALAKWGYKRQINQLDNFLSHLIQRRRNTSVEDDIDLLGILIKAGLSDDLIRDQLMTMVIAGQDTATAALTWTLYLLAEHPDVMQKAIAEVDHVIGHHQITPKDIQNLVYLQQVMNESMRLYPPIHVGSRITQQPITYQNYCIQGGTRIFYSIYLTHRHPAYWPDPHKFDPERFAPGIKHEPYTYLPFGGGPRNCLGMVFAQTQIKVILARLLQQYTLERVGSAPRPYMGATLEPAPGLRIRVHSRP